MKQKIDVEDLRLGMYVSELDRPWLESPFLFQGFPIRTQDELQVLRTCCKYVYVDTEQSREWLPPRSKPLPEHRMEVDHRFETQGINISQSSGGRHEYTDRRSFEEEVGEAVNTYQRAHRYIRNVLEDVRLGRSVDVQEARQTADRIADSVVRNEHALVWLTQLKHRDEYTSQHSLNVCVLAVLFGRHLGLAERELRDLGLGALLHDIGKMRVPLEVLNKPDRLTREEVALLKEHPNHGYEILKNAVGVPGSAVDVAYCHHERVDGSGYPRGLEGEHIPLFAKIVSVVDVYDAITSDRVYHIGISPHEALNLMYGWAPKSFDRGLLEQFIRCLGIYPIGSIVELDTGEVGVVITVNRARHLRPLVILLLDRTKAPYQRRKLLNLHSQERAGNVIGIKKILPSNAYGINVRQVILDEQAEAVAEFGL